GTRNPWSGRISVERGVDDWRFGNACKAVDRRGDRRGGGSCHRNGELGDDEPGGLGEAAWQERGAEGLADRFGPRGRAPHRGEGRITGMSETPLRHETPRENVGARRLGRAGFIGVVGAGIATLFYGKAISRVTSRVTNPVSDATGLTRLVPSGGWRIYTVADTMPRFDPATWRLRIDGLVERPVEISHRQLLALP